MTSEPFIRQQINGNIFYLIENSVNLIKQYSPPVSRIEGLKRIDVYPYPYEALREVIINAIVHRDYFIPSEITIRVFKDRIEIANPGEVPLGIDFDKLVNGENNLSVRRNQFIADVLDSAGYMDRAGYGFIKMLTALQSQGVPKPEFPKVQGSFKAIIYAGTIDSGLSKTKDLDSYPMGVRIILKKIIESGTKGISNQDLVKGSGYTNVYVSNITRILEDENQIVKKRIGNQLHLFLKSS
jgi:predicted HTH transcriptional regulator